MKIRDILDGSRVLIWGHGLEGRCMEGFIKSHCSARSVSVYEGSQDGIDEEAFDCIIKSPGIKGADRKSVV